MKIFPIGNNGMRPPDNAPGFNVKEINKAIKKTKKQKLKWKFKIKIKDKE